VSPSPPASHPTVDRPSLASLFVQLSCAGQHLGTATGFLVEKGSSRFLITNRHVTSGRDHKDNIIDPNGRTPDQMTIWHHVAGQLGNWMAVTEDLYTPSGTPRWLEHPGHHHNVDVVALPLENTSGWDAHSYNPWNQGPKVDQGVTLPLFIIGFPFGIAGGGFLGVWVQGTIASEPSLDWHDLPCFLIDSRTRPGQSGSPVIFYSRGGPVSFAPGSLSLSPARFEQFVGVYSGRIHDKSDLGIVWKASVVREIVDAAPPPPSP